LVSSALPHCDFSPDGDRFADAEPLQDSDALSSEPDCSSELDDCFTGDRPRDDGGLLEAAFFLRGFLLDGDLCDPELEYRRGIQQGTWRVPRLEGNS